MDLKIKQFVYRVRARLKEQQIITNLIKYVGIGLSVGILLSFISMVIPFYYAVPAAAGVIIIFFIIGIIMGIRRTPSPMDAALLADARGHKEKISTAFFLKGKEDPFSTLQKKDALQIIEHFQIRREFPIHLQWKRVLLMLGLALVFVTSTMIDTPARDEARVGKDVAKEAEEDIARLEKIEKKLEENKEISETEAAEMKEQIETAKKELSEVDSREDLKKAEDRIIKKMEIAGEKTENKTLSETLSEAAKEAGEAAEKRESDLAKEAEEALARAEKGSKKDKQEAYEKLKKLADSMGDEALKKAAEEYKASSYSDGDYANAERALNETLSNMASNRTDLADNSNGTASSGNNNQNNAGQSNSQNSNQTNSGNSGNNQNGGQNSGGQGNNQNGSQNSGNTGNGQNGQGGSGQNGNGNGSGNGGSGNSSGGGWNYGSKEGQEGARKTNENITVPDGETGEDENLTGKANGNNSSTKEKSNQSQTWSGNKVSYGEVSAEYKKKAYKKVNGSSYPGKLKDKIKNYFDGLN